MKDGREYTQADIGDLLAASVNFTERFAQAKQAQALERPWYAYDSLGNLDHFDRLLNGRHRKLLALLDGKPLLDIGCADGQLAFFFESLGIPVTAVDNPGTNANAMLGVRALRSVLSSSIEIHEIDLDAHFEAPPPGRFGLTFLLGVLYHLQNPMYVLSKLSRHTRYCLLSTRIARFTPNGSQSIRDLPLAWFAGADEINKDCTNFWIFSETSLRRIIERSGWRILEFCTVGDIEASDPVHAEHDERAFCLMESTRVLDHADLLDGWYAVESAGWRWTAQRFSVRLSRAAAFRLQLFVPQATIETFGSLSVQAEVSGEVIASAKWTENGPAVLEIALPDAAREGAVEVQFTLDHAVPLIGPDERSLGVIVSSADLM